MTTVMEKFYCKECINRNDKREISRSVQADGSGVAIPGTGKEALGNTAKFCGLGFKVNPKSLEATQNAIAQGSKVYNWNPWKRTVMEAIMM